MVTHRVHALNDVFIGFSHVGSGGLIWLIIGALAALVWKRPAIFLYVALASLVADVLAYAAPTYYGMLVAEVQTAA